MPGAHLSLRQMKTSEHWPSGMDGAGQKGLSGKKWHGATAEIQGPVKSRLHAGQLRDADVGATPAGSPTAARPVAMRSKSEAPPSSRRSPREFQLHEDDSSDDDACGSVARAQVTPGWDVEKLFEFDINELVQLARTTAWGLLPAGRTGLAAMGPDLSEAGPEQEDEEAGSPEDVAREGVTEREDAMRALQDELAFKDAQIERLRRVVCELLCWGAQHWPQADAGSRPALNALKSSSRSRATPCELRATAPEFVPLGIPSLAAIPTKDLLPRRARAHSYAPGVWKTQQPSRSPCPNEAGAEGGLDVEAEPSETPCVPSSPTEQAPEVAAAPAPEATAAPRATAAPAEAQSPGADSRSFLRQRSRVRISSLPPSPFKAAPPSCSEGRPLATPCSLAQPTRSPCRQSASPCAAEASRNSPGRSQSPFSQLDPTVWPSLAETSTTAGSVRRRPRSRPPVVSSRRGRSAGPPLQNPGNVQAGG